MECPAFEILSRFLDGDLRGDGEAAVVAHLAACGGCRATLSSIEEVDGLLTLALPPAAPARRFRLVRPAMITMAAGFFFAVTLAVVLTLPSGNGGDSPVAVAEASPPPVGPVTPSSSHSFKVPGDPRPFSEPLFPDNREISGWQTTESVSDLKSVDSAGRRVVTLAAHGGGRKRWGLMSWHKDFVVGDGLSFDIEYRIQKSEKGGRMQVLLQSGTPKAGRTVLRWSVTPDEEILEAQESRAKPAVLWSSKTPVDTEWHVVKLLVTRTDVVLTRDGAETVRKPHGWSLERVSLSLGTTADRRSRENHEPFECQVGRVDVRPQKAQ